MNLLETIKSDLPPQMNNSERIEFAVSIKHWCDIHPNASDDELRMFLEQIENTVLLDMVETVALVF